VNAAVTPADELQARAGSLLAPLADVRVKDDGSLGFEYGTMLCSLRGMNLADGLDVLSLICVLAWDLSADDSLIRRIVAGNDTPQFGTIAVSERGGKADVLLRYTFPAAGLGDHALATKLFLVLSGAEDSRAELVAEPR
jgi:hypothetical protein